jgi:hypothetical protein
MQTALGAMEVSLSGESSGPNIAAPCVEFALDYSGFDAAHGLSPEVSNRCGQPDRTFQYADAQLTELPDADLALCKNVLQYLSNADVKLVLNKLQKHPTIIISRERNSRPLG